MCAPILGTGLQAATALAGVLSQGADARAQQRLTRQQARLDADAATAEAETARREAGRRIAAARVARNASGLDPQSDSSLSVLAGIAADGSGAVTANEQRARVALYRGGITEGMQRRASRLALQRSILGVGTGLLATAAPGRPFAVPGW